MDERDNGRDNVVGTGGIDHFCSPGSRTVEEFEMIDAATMERRRAIIEAIDAWANDNDVTVLLIGGDEEKVAVADAIAGVTLSPRPAVVYVSCKIIEAFMEFNDWDYETAVDHYGFNTERALPYYHKEDNPPILIDSVEGML